MQNTIPNLILLVSDYCWDEYSVASYNFGNGHERVGNEWDKS